MLLLDDTRERKHEETPRDTIILSTNDLALLLVDLTEGQKSGDRAVNFTRFDSFGGIHQLRARRRTLGWNKG